MFATVRCGADRKSTDEDIDRSLVCLRGTVWRVTRWTLQYELGGGLESAASGIVVPHR